MKKLLKKMVSEHGCMPSIYRGNDFYWIGWKIQHGQGVTETTKMAATMTKELAEFLMDGLNALTEDEEY